MKTKLMNEMFKWGVLSAIIAVAMPELTYADGGDTISNVVKDVAQNELPVLPYILSTVCYIGGSFMMVSGALSLKKHAENPGGEPMAKGISRLLTGGAITSVPALTNIVQKTTKISGSEANYNPFSVSF